VVYFHENQLTYPVRFESERDYQFAMTNMTTALAANGVWFNSAFHRDEFLTALTGFLKRMPNHDFADAPQRIKNKTKIYPQGINVSQAGNERKPGPVRILWAGRWEHDKNPEDFFKAMKILKEKNIDFRLDVLGEQFRDAPEVFTWAEDYFAEHIDRWGFQENRSDYQSALTEADIVVSTANHEFFGISIAEAIAAGAYPVLPKRLAYPEIIANIETTAKDEFFYDGTVEDLTEKLIHLIQRVINGILWKDRFSGLEGMKKFHWNNLAKTMDDALENIFD
jgi:glycosyltransferase involved in cell wall biosynthesis